ncbi:hypothetical protein [Arthrobacter sp. Soil763]|uniref:hypothetical protein n=1 Tax=Arthrobacter sp. Soil763 TaxID=1736402 RepID=UPI0006FD4AF5|nr:hypothetical protein [Arthrobacter sp. Soil763]KRE77283.1 hypothetical protein ASG71_13220 [Arthrobacter sp. Soil763]
MIATVTRRWRRTLAGAALSAALAVGSLSACASPAPELDGAAAQQLQAQVLAVTRAAAANDTAGALKLLDELVPKLDAAAADGKVSFRRHQSIKTAIDAVRADLVAKAAAAAKAARDAAAKKAAADKAAADKAAAEKAAADKAAADKAAADQAAAQAAAAAAAAAAAKSEPAKKPKGKGKGGG